MKRIRVHKRDVLERTGYKAHPYRKVTEYVVEFDCKEYSNGAHRHDDESLRKKFELILDTRKREDVTALIKETSMRSESGKFLRKCLAEAALKGEIGAEHRI